MLSPELHVICINHLLASKEIKTDKKMFFEDNSVA